MLGTIEPGREETEVFRIFRRFIRQAQIDQNQETWRQFIAY